MANCAQLSQFGSQNRHSHLTGPVIWSTLTFQCGSAPNHARFGRWAGFTARDLGFTDFQLRLRMIFGAVLEMGMCRKPATDLIRLTDAALSHQPKNGAILFQQCCAAAKPSYPGRSKIWALTSNSSAPR